MATWTTLDLISLIQSQGMLPDASSGSYSPAVLLNLASWELRLTLAGQILSVRAKYYETFQDTAVQAGVSKLLIPYRAIGGVLSAVQYLYGLDIRELNPIEPVAARTTNPAMSPSNYYFENNAIVLYPTPNSSQGTVRQRYLQRPSRLEQTINCAQVTAFDPVAMTVTCAGGLPSTWTTSSLIDFIPQNAARATPYGIDLAPTNISSTTLTFAALPVTPAGYANAGSCCVSV